MREESESFDTINDLRAVRYTTTLGQTKQCQQNLLSFFPNKSALFAHIATR